MLDYKFQSVAGINLDIPIICFEHFHAAEEKHYHWHYAANNLASTLHHVFVEIVVKGYSGPNQVISLRDSSDIELDRVPVEHQFQRDDKFAGKLTSIYAD